MRCPIFARKDGARAIEYKPDWSSIVMSFVIQGLDPAMFGSVSLQMQATFNGAPMERHEVTESPGFPCRITLDDAEVGHTVLLVSYPHHQANSPYAQSGPIFVTETAMECARYVDEIPPALARRTLSLRAYDADGTMIDAVIVEGDVAKEAIKAMFEDQTIVRIDAHNATRGCFAAHIMRQDD
jgi:Protein of unknown function (DUF1203)